MKVNSINVGVPREWEWKGRAVQTGIFKSPVEGRVRAGWLGLDGDGQADLRNHGGPDKAVYAYPREHYDYWAAELSRDDFKSGQFGENLTVDGLLEDDVCIGDRYRVGGAGGPLLEVTQPRMPCAKLDLRMGMDKFSRQFHESLRTGFYLRVLEEGEIDAGDAIEREMSGEGKMAVREIYRLLMFDRSNRDGHLRALALPALSPVWRREFEKRLKR
jgi:MOSC domain-containing protein YiiM